MRAGAGQDATGRDGKGGAERVGATAARRDRTGRNRRGEDNLERAGRGLDETARCDKALGGTVSPGSSRRLYVLDLFVLPF